MARTRATILRLGLIAGPWAHTTGFFFFSFSYMAAAALATYAHLYVGPRSVRPWEATKEDILDDEMRTRADDRVQKWTNVQRDLEREAQQQKRDKKAEREARKVAEAKAEADRELAEKARAFNAKRRMSKLPGLPPGMVLGPDGRPRRISKNSGAAMLAAKAEAAALADLESGLDRNSSLTVEEVGDGEDEDDSDG